MRENLESLELSENRVEMIEISSKTPSVPQIAHLPRHKTNCQNSGKNRLRFTDNWLITKLW